MTAVGTRRMAKKKRTPNTEHWKIKPIIATMRGSAQFKEWLEKAAKADRGTLATFLERAAIHYAKSIGFNDPPPDR